MRSPHQGPGCAHRHRDVAQLPEEVQRSGPHSEGDRRRCQPHLVHRPHHRLVARQTRSRTSAPTTFPLNGNVVINGGSSVAFATSWLRSAPPRNGSCCWTLGHGSATSTTRSLRSSLEFRCTKSPNAPAGDLDPLNTGPNRQGTVIVSPKDRDLYHELAEAAQGGVRIPSQRRSDQVPIRRQQLRQGFGAVIDRQGVHVPPQGIPAQPTSGPSALPCPYWGKGPCGWNNTPCLRCRYVRK